MELGESAVGALVVLSNGNGQYIGTPGFVVGGQDSWSALRLGAMSQRGSQDSPIISPERKKKSPFKPSHH